MKNAAYVIDLLANRCMTFEKQVGEHTEILQKNLQQKTKDYAELERKTGIILNSFRRLMAECGRTDQMPSERARSIVLDVQALLDPDTTLTQIND